MQKYVIIFSKKLNWYIYCCEMEMGVNPDNSVFYFLNKKIYSYTNLGSKVYKLPNGLANRQIATKYVFDSRGEAINSVDSLIYEKKLEFISDAEKQILKLNKSIELIKESKPKGHYRNLIYQKKP